MKKITAFTIAAIMALGMTACGDTTEKASEKEQESKATTVESQEENNENSVNEISKDELLKSANGNAKTGYNAVAEYLVDLDTQGKIAEATEQAAAECAAKEISLNDGISGTVGVSFEKSEDYDFLNFTVQFRADEDSTIIGQYPDAAHELEEIPQWSAKAEVPCKTAE